MKNGYTDNYYMQMAQNIRRYKGIRPIPELRGSRTMRIDGGFDDWSKTELEYRDTIGDVFHRNSKGYGGLEYSNDSGRNDITTSKVSIDKKNVYFYAKAAAALTPHTGKNWMLLLIDTDENHNTGWYGYDVLINQKVIDGRTTTLMRYDKTNPAQPWSEAARLDYRYSGTELELAVPRRWLGSSGDAVTFDFHWCDHPADLHDPISLCVNGDSAPNRRFNYRCMWKK
jgi:hypothetical protein